MSAPNWQLVSGAILAKACPAQKGEAKQPWYYPSGMTGFFWIETPMLSGPVSWVFSSQQPGWYVRRYEGTVYQVRLTGKSYMTLIS